MDGLFVLRLLPPGAYEAEFEIRGSHTSDEQRRAARRRRAELTVAGGHGAVEER